jgi:type VI secretion system secreted protein VgrG
MSPIKHLPTLNPYQLNVLHLPALDSHVDDVDAEEAFNRPYRYQIRFSSADSALDAAQFLRHNADFTLLGGVLGVVPQKRVHGVITDFCRLSSSVDGARYQLTLEPKFALLHQQRRSLRFFVNQSVIDVVDALLREHGFKGWEFEFTLKHSYPKRPQINQVNESDGAFIERLLAESGLFFTFAMHPDTGTDILHIGDSQQSYGAQCQLPVQAPGGLADNGASVWDITLNQKISAASVSVNGYNPLQAHVPIVTEPVFTAGTRTRRRHQPRARQRLLLGAARARAPADRTNPNRRHQQRRPLAGGANFTPATRRAWRA